MNEIHTDPCPRCGGDQALTGPPLNEVYCKDAECFREQFKTFSKSLKEVIMIKQPIQALQSGLSRRWHSNPDMARTPDDLSQHQWTVVMVVLSLKPNASRELIIEALTHDVGEMVAGDLSYDFKINNPEIAEKHKVDEMFYREQIVTAQTINQEETDVLKVADWLSSYWWVAINNPNLLDRHDWIEQKNYFTNFCEDKPFANLAINLISRINGIALNGFTEKIELNWKFGKGLEEYDAA